MGRRLQKAELGRQTELGLNVSISLTSWDTFLGSVLPPFSIQ